MRSPRTASESVWWCVLLFCFFLCFARTLPTPRAFIFFVSCTLFAGRFLKTQRVCCKFSLQHPGNWVEGGNWCAVGRVNHGSCLPQARGLFLFQRRVLLALTELWRGRIEDALIRISRINAKEQSFNCYVMKNKLFPCFPPILMQQQRGSVYSTGYYWIPVKVPPWGLAAHCSNIGQNGKYTGRGGGGSRNTLHCFLIYF